MVVHFNLKYFSSNGLKINVLKSEHIIFGHPRTKKVVIEGRVEAEKVKLLGITVSNHYKFDAHVDAITEKIARRNGQLNGIAGVDTMKMLASATILSVASYGSFVYARDKKNINLIQMKLNKTMGLVTRSRLKTHVADMLNDLNWMKFEIMVAYNKIMLMHRILSSSAAPYCMMLMQKAMHQTRYLMRERELCIAWRSKQARKGFSSFLVTAVSLYNQVKLMGKVMKVHLIRLVKKTLKS